MPNNQLTVRNTLTPDVWSMIESVAAASFESRQFGIVKQGEASIKLLFCYENNLPLSASNIGLYVVKGRLAVQSNIIASQFRMHPVYDYEIVELTNRNCIINILKDGEVWRSCEFNQDDAKQAGLLSKDVWKKYPKNMYFGRCLTNAYRWFCPELFSQPVYIPEELDMNVDKDGNPIIEAQYDVSEPKQMTLQDLQALYSVAEILAANDGHMPTPDNIEMVAEKLATMKSEDENDSTS